MKIRRIFHPFLFGIFPILSLYSHNIDLANFSDIFTPLLIVVLSVMVVFFILQKIFKNTTKTSIASSLFFFLFFLFGHYATAIPEINLGGGAIKNSDYFIALFFTLTVYIFSILLLYSSKKSFEGLSSYFSIVAIILVAFPIINIISYFSESHGFIFNQNDKQVNAAKQNESYPDIYYLVFDGHGRSDILKEYYDYDNTNFLENLAKKGFYIADKSRSNYPQTYLSMASSLNFMYLDEVIPEQGIESSDRSVLRSMLKNNQVYDVLKDKGYKFVALPDTWTGTYKNIKADIVLSEINTLGEFEKILINNTPLRIFLESGYNLALQKNKVLFLFDKIPEIAKINKPTFTYVHCLSPHPPFLFDEEGNLYEDVDLEGLDGDYYFIKNPDRSEYIKKYKGQSAYINKRIEKMVDNILKNSEEDPIIILQSDHGPGLNTYWEDPDKTDMRERFGILNAFYAPEEIKKELYSSITPVNTFRFIFNGLFNQNLEILEDKSYFSTWSRPYDFIDVTKRADDK